MYYSVRFKSNVLLSSDMVKFAFILAYFWWIVCLCFPRCEIKFRNIFVWTSHLTSFKNSYLVAEDLLHQQILFVVFWRIKELFLSVFDIKLQSWNGACLEKKLDHLFLLRHLTNFKRLSLWSEISFYFSTVSSECGAYHGE